MNYERELYKLLKETKGNTLTIYTVDRIKSLVYGIKTSEWREGAKSGFLR